MYSSIVDVYLAQKVNQSTHIMISHVLHVLLMNTIWELTFIHSMWEFALLVGLTCMITLLLDTIIMGHVSSTYVEPTNQDTKMGTYGMSTTTQECQEISNYMGSLRTGVNWVGTMRTTMRDCQNANKIVGSMLSRGLHINIDHACKAKVQRSYTLTAYRLLCHGSIHIHAMPW